MNEIVVLPVAPTKPSTTSKLLTNIAIKKVANSKTALSMTNLPSGMSSPPAWSSTTVSSSSDGVVGKRNLSRLARAGWSWRG